MARSDVTFELKASPDQPIFLAVAASIVGEIERGRLRPGDRVPGTRAVARMLGLHRNTVDAAFHELTMQGWLVAEPSRGTFVAHDLPDIAPFADAPIGRRVGGLPLPTHLLAVDGLKVGDGTPDPRIMPHAEFARAFRRALSLTALLTGSTYGDPRGTPALREALAGYLAAERGLITSADNLLITRGSQMGLYLAAATLRPGETIAVEQPGYPLAWAAFRAAGMTVVGVAIDGGGIDPDALDALAASDPTLRAVYVTPHHQYPTTVTMGAGRRLRLLEIARRRGLTIIEDDYDHEYRFDGRPVLPLAARAGMDQPIIYVGSLSKLLAPAVRLGYAVASRDIIARMATRREAIDRQGDVPLEQALASLIADGDLRRHARKARRIYAGRRDVLAREIRSRLGSLISFDLPAGGLALWLRVAEDVDARDWSGAAARAGLTITDGSRFALDLAAPPNAFRFGFANLNDGELTRAISLLAASAPPRVGAD